MAEQQNPLDIVHYVLTAGLQSRENQKENISNFYKASQVTLMDKHLGTNRLNYFFSAIWKSSNDSYTEVQ